MVEVMEISPTPDQQAFILQAMQAGRIARPEDAAKQAMALWEERERKRAEILASLDTAEESLARGEGIPITKNAMDALARDVKQRGRARLEAEKPAPR